MLLPNITRAFLPSGNVDWWSVRVNGGRFIDWNARTGAVDTYAEVSAS